MFEFDMGGFVSAGVSVRVRRTSAALSADLSCTAARAARPAGFSCVITKDFHKLAQREFSPRASTQEARLSLHATCGGHVQPVMLKVLRGCFQARERRCFHGS